MDDTVTVTDADMLAVAEEARRLANLEFLGSEHECGYCAGAEARDADEDVRVLEMELGRTLSPEERRRYDVGYREGAIDRVRFEEDAAGGVPPWWAEVPL